MTQDGKSIFPEPKSDLARARRFASFLATIRDFFNQRSVIELVTPCIVDHPCADSNVDAFSLGQQYLRTSPEHEMKRWVATHKTDCYQLGPVFRDEEITPLHATNFLLLEWYRIGFDSTALIQETIDLLGELQIENSYQEISYRELCLRQLDFDIEGLSKEQLQKKAKLFGFDAGLDTPISVFYDFFYSSATKTFDDTRIRVVRFFPEVMANQSAPLPHDPRYCDRFEIFIGGIEICNGGQELTDSRHYATRLYQAGASNLIDPLLAASMDALPPCSGNAVGVERLFSFFPTGDSG